jgi:hypothetical protein
MPVFAFGVHDIDDDDLHHHDHLHRLPQHLLPEPKL